MKQHIPNILTIGRLVLSLVMFAALILLARDLSASKFSTVQLYGTTAFVTFTVAAVSDFFDGMLARRWQVTSTAGAILDPIADKILVCAAILGLLGLNIADLLIPGAIILFREFAVSALREVLAPRGVKLPVTFLAKTKTTLQLVALGVYLLLIADAGWASGAAAEGGVITVLERAAPWLIWVAAAVTLWTGGEYALAARKALRPPA